jgi:hypothetical protein
MVRATIGISAPFRVRPPPRILIPPADRWIAGRAPRTTPVRGQGPGLKGTETSDWAGDQVLLRIHSTCSTSAATNAGSKPSTGKTPVS